MGCVGDPVGRVIETRRQGSPCRATWCRIDARIESRIGRVGVCHREEEVQVVEFPRKGANGQVLGDLLEEPTEVEEDLGLAVAPRVHDDPGPRCPAPGERVVYIVSRVARHPLLLPAQAQLQGDVLGHLPGVLDIPGIILRGCRAIETAKQPADLLKPEAGWTTIAQVERSPLHRQVAVGSGGAYSVPEYRRNVWCPVKAQARARQVPVRAGVPVIPAEVHILELEADVQLMAAPGPEVFRAVHIVLLVVANGVLEEADSTGLVDAAAEARRGQAVSRPVDAARVR